MGYRREWPPPGWYRQRLRHRRFRSYPSAECLHRWCCNYRCQGWRCHRCRRDLADRWHDPARFHEQPYLRSRQRTLEIRGIDLRKGAHMADYTVTTSPDEESALQWVASQADPPEDAATYFDKRMHAVL